MSEPTETGMATNGGATLPKSGFMRAMVTSAIIIIVYVGIAWVIIKSIGNDTITIAGYQIVYSVWISALVGMGIILWLNHKSVNLSALGLFRPNRWWGAILMGIVGAIVIYILAVIGVVILTSLGLVTPPDEAGQLLVTGEISISAWG